jgi:hypothetical protein
MGLDMYLNAKRYIWDFKDGERGLGEALAAHFPELKGRSVKTVIVEAIYWRKSNQIHNWFVTNVQGGDDDCGTYEVEREHLEDLQQVVKKALADHNAALLPPVSGFLFGNTEIDEYYWRDLQYTADELDKVLTNFTKQWYFEYHSSW